MPDQAHTPHEGAFPARPPKRSTSPDLARLFCWQGDAEPAGFRVFDACEPIAIRDDGVRYLSITHEDSLGGEAIWHIERRADDWAMSCADGQAIASYPSLSSALG